MTRDFATLCFLSYLRPQFIVESIESAKQNAEYPCEIVVHDDGSDPDLLHQLTDLVARGQISKLVLSPTGHNEGVGAALNRCIGVASGDPIVKLDQDLLFEPGWLRKTVEWLDADYTIGMFGLFKYHHHPVEWKVMEIDQPTLGAYHYVEDFVGSAMVIPREVLDEYGMFEEHSAAFAEDVAYKTNLQEQGLCLALPDEDLATNRGFGIGPSTVVVADGTVREIKTRPVLFGV